MDSRSLRRTNIRAFLLLLPSFWVMAVCAGLKISEVTRSSSDKGA